MAAKTITVRADLVERLESLAQIQGRTLDDVFEDLLEQYSALKPNWAFSLAEAMEETDIDWQDEASLSEHSQRNFEQDAFDKWQRAQDEMTDNRD
jgi:hypothetical protein